MISIDDIYFVITSTVIAAALVLLVFNAKLNMMVFLVINLSTVLVGLIVLESSLSVITSYAGGVSALIVGYVMVSRHTNRTIGDVVNTETLRSIPDYLVYSIVVFAGSFGVYHLVVAGIPVFSSSIEVKRFDFTSSGLFGVPGRMYLYGIPFAWMLAAANAQALKVRWRSYIPWRIATFFLVATALMSGFKSGLLAATYTMLIAYFIISKDSVTVGSFIRRFWWAFSLPILYGLSVATSYSTYDVAGQPLWSQLLRRVTVVGAEPVQYAMDGRVSNLVENGLLNDLTYFIAKYSGGDTARMFSLERSISADIINADPSSSAWTTPVTLGGFAEITYTFGPLISIVCMMLVGMWVGKLHHAASNSAVRLAASAVVAFGIYNWLLKGGLVYYIFNLTAVSLILMSVGAIAWVFRPRTRLSPSVVLKHPLVRVRPTRIVKYTGV